MVDLGFLWISFFILTTELTESTVTNLYMLHDHASIKIAESKSLTVLLSGSNKILFCDGTEFATNTRTNETLTMSYPVEDEWFVKNN